MHPSAHPTFSAFICSLVLVCLYVLHHVFRFLSLHVCLSVCLSCFVYVYHVYFFRYFCWYTIFHLLIVIDICYALSLLCFLTIVGFLSSTFLSTLTLGLRWCVWISVCCCYCSYSQYICCLIHDVLYHCHLFFPVVVFFTFSFFC